MTEFLDTVAFVGVVDHHFRQAGFIPVFQAKTQI